MAHQLPLKAEVDCTDGHAGNMTAVIMHPIKKYITHIGVEHKDLEYLVPISRIADTGTHKITLDCSKAELKEMPDFLTTNYDLGDPEAYDMKMVAGSSMYVSPYVMSIEGASALEEQVPPGELAFHPGAHVQATDGELGKVREFVVDGESGNITHLVLQDGHFLGKKQVTIPITAVDNIAGFTVYLNLDKATVDALPHVRVKRH